DGRGDLHQRHTTATLRAVGAEFGEPSVVRPGAGETELGVEITGQAETGAERRAGAALDGVGVGIDHLGRDAVGVHFLVAPGGVPAAFETFLVLLEPLLGELRAARAHPVDLLGDRGAAGEELVELRVVLALEVVAVQLGRQAGVRIGRDHDVWVVSGRCHGSPPEMWWLSQVSSSQIACQYSHYAKAGDG